MAIPLERVVEVGMVGIGRGLVVPEAGIPVDGKGLKIHSLDQDGYSGSQFYTGHYERINGNASRVPLVVSMRAGLHIPRDHSRSRHGNKR